MTRSAAGPRMSAGVGYLVVLTAMMLEQPGKTTSDTKAALLDAPGHLLQSTFSLWNPEMSLGELQNQAYGYLFPMGPFFAGFHALHVPAWITERLWSWLVIVVACEGARRVCHQLGVRPWSAVAAGFAYGLSVRIVSEVGVRSAEILPVAVLPWVLLPVLWVICRRIGTRTGALLSAVAFLFSGAVNATGTVAGLPVVVVFALWARRHRLVGWSLLGWWSLCLALVSGWWISSLLLLGRYSPPFFDYVEDARTTTSTTGFDASLRGASNWVGYLATGADKTWPAAWSLDYQPLLVIGTGLLVAISLAGLAAWRSPWRTPLAACAMIGLACLTLGHNSTAWLESPLSPHVRAMLDEPFALLRNVSKVDSVLRLPVAVGLGAALDHSADLARSFREGRRRARAGAMRIAAVVAALLVVASAQPVLLLNLRTPGWSSVPSYWPQAAAFLARQHGQNGAWLVPGSGFGIQTWGWTMDEPLSMVARSAWVSRSQVPLAPAETIRMLSSLEDVLDTGSGSAQLGAMLRRLGLGFVVVRHDLEPTLGDPPPSSVVSIALARSSGIRRVATFGALDFGPAIEIFEVTSRDRDAASDLTVVPSRTARTVSSGPADVLSAVGSGLVAPDQAAVVAGDTGWDRDAVVVGDGYRLRERQFGRVHANEGEVLARGQPRHAVRRVENYPGSPKAQPVVADYHGIRYVDASSSQAYVESLGPVRPEDAPYSAVDADPKTGWVSAYPTRPLGQWLAVHYDARRPFGAVRIHTDVDPSRSRVLRWRVSAGGRTASAAVDTRTGLATADLHGARGRTLRLTVSSVGRNRRQQIAVREIEATGLPVERSLVVPPVKTTAPTAYLFGSTPETRPCVPTLVAPDCDPRRFRPAEESAGIDREITTDHAGAWFLGGTVVARADPATMPLLDAPGARVTMTASSTYFDDPTVSARMAYDGTPATSWIAAPEDASPTLVVDFRRPRRIDRISVAAPAAPGVAPATATLVAGEQTRHVDLGGFSQFAPVVARHLEITFQNPTRAGRPIGLGDIRIGRGRTAVPLDGTATTGAYCGFGPAVYVDGQRHETRVEGLVGDVSSSGPLTLALCGNALEIGPGGHRIRVASTPQFQPVRVVLAQPGAIQQHTSGSTRTLRVREETATSRSADVGPGGEALLVSRGNWNTGWTATLDGKRLEPQRIDGWAQGWRLPAGSGGRLSIHFGPQRPYLVGLIGGLLVAAVMLVLGVVVAWRTRLRPPVEPRPVPRGRRRLEARRAVVVVAGAAWLAFGLPGLVGVLLARVRAPRSVQVALGGVLIAVGAIITAVQFWRSGPAFPPDVSDALAGTGAVLVLAVALSGARVRPR